MKQQWTVGGEAVDAEVSRQGDAIAVTWGGRTITVRGQRAGDGVWHMSVDGKPHKVVTAAAGGARHLAVDGLRLTAHKAQAGRRRGARDEGHGLTSPMPGQVLKVLVKVGDKVSKGDTLMIIEAMKMEHAIRAPWDGTVARLGFAEGDMVTPGADLAEVDPDGVGAAGG